jgi:hypothetical protein
VIALGLSIALVVFWTILGYAFLTTTYQKPNLIQNALLAPAVGIAVTLLAVFFINRLGVPVGQFGLLLLIVLLLLSAFALWRFRPSFPLRRLLPFGAILLFALLINGRPLLEFGFDWMSYGNDDYANYVVSAHRLLVHGYFDSPLPSDLASGREQFLFSWLLYADGGSRIGADLILAWVSSVTGLSTPNVFMPVIIAFHVSLISAACALVYQSRRYRRAALLTCFMLSVSALLTLGAMYQLIAQVIGMALACAVAVVLFRPYANLGRNAALRLGILTAFVVGALMISYPEIMPFIGLGFLIYIGVGVARRQWVIAWRSLLYVGGTSVVLFLVVLNFYIFEFSDFLQRQFLAGVGVSEQPLFPYFLIPSGLSAFWGFQPFYFFPAEPFLSLGIIAGALLLAVGFFFALRYSWRRTPSAVIAFAMSAFGIYLFVRRGDFGLFKLTMFIQPFFIGIFVIGWLELSRRWRSRWQVIPLLLIAGYGLVTQVFYVEISRGLNYAGPSEVPNGSAQNILTEFAHLIDTTQAAYYESDSNHPTLYKIQSISLDQHPAEFLSAAEISFLEGSFAYAFSDPNITRDFYSPFRNVTSELYTAFQQTYRRQQFNLMNGADTPASNTFYTYNFSGAPQEGRMALLTTPFQSALNFTRLNWFQGDYYIARPLTEVENYLVFVESQLGQQYYIPLFYDSTSKTSTEAASLFRVESDYFYPQGVYTGVGRHLLFEVLNPALTVRVRLNFTTTLRRDGAYVLPPAVIIGDSRSAFPMMGRGSARVFSPPLKSQQIDGRYYLELDMGDDGQQYPSVRTGLMTLYGTDILLDRRRVVGYTRDISVLSEEEYASLTPPTSLASFPADLANPDLEYSGIYEDGWLSEASFFCLSQPQADMPLRIQALNPLIDDPSFTQDLTVLVDSQEVLQQNFALGEIDISLPSSAAGRHCIELRFSNSQRLPNGDDRPFAVQLKFIGYQ